MRVSREPSVARSTRPFAVSAARWCTAFATSVVLVVPTTLITAEGAWAAPPDPQPRAAVRSVPAAAAATRSVGIPPIVHNVAIPAVPRADRAATAQQSGSREAIQAKAALAPAVPLVAHVQSRVAGGFSMLGVTWTATGGPVPVVAVRTERSGTWTPWTDLEVDPDEGPSSQEEPTARGGTAPVFVGDADSVEVDVYSPDGTPPAGLSVAAIDPGRASMDTAVAKQSTTSAVATAKPTRDGLPPMPRIVTRRQWGADERLGDPCWAPRYGRTFKAVFVHHTAGSNTYTRQESASVVRGIYAYHTQSRGWCDIGYNFLVDRYGTVYEGRAGGIRKAVRGAHSGDYNVNSTGISLMGEFTNTTPTEAMRRSLITLVAWRLGVAYQGGYGRARINGAVFKRISGHRDAMSTACPGQRVYDWLPTLRRKVNKRLDNFTSVIKRWWIKTDRQHGYLGNVRIGEVAVGGGRHTTFTRARTYFKDGRRRTIRVGDLLTTYLKAGEVNGPLGYPVSYVRSPRHGEVADFEGGSAYWSPSAGGRILVTGKVLKRYRQSHGPRGKLGYPETGLRTTADGSYARFRFGTIRYDKTTGRTTVSYR